MLCVYVRTNVHTMYGKKYVFCIRYCKSDLYVILKLLEYVIQKIYKTKQNKKQIKCNNANKRNINMQTYE